MNVVLLVLGVLGLIAMVAFPVQVVRDLVKAKEVKERRRRHWREAATRLGFAFEKRSMRGSVDEIAVEVRYAPRGDPSIDCTEVEAKPAVPLPAGLYVRQKRFGVRLATPGRHIPIADKKLWVCGDDPTAVEDFLAHPGAETALQAIARSNNKAWTSVRDGKLIVERFSADFGEIETLVQAAVDAAQGLDRAARAPWKALAVERGLLHEETGSSATLDGRLRGLPVLVRARHGGPQPQTSIRVELEGELPRPVRIRAGTDGERIGDPILDGRVVVEGTAGPGDEARAAAVAWLRARLSDDNHDLRGCLMDVLHGLPGAVIEGGAVHASLPGRPGRQLAETLDRLLDLGVALSDGAPADTRDAAHRGTAQPGREAERGG